MSVAISSPSDDNTGLLQLLTEDLDESTRLLIQRSPKTSDYLTHLTRLSLDELVREPMTLRTNQAQIKREAQQLTYSDYPAFLHAESCRRALGTTLDNLEDDCGRLLNTTTPSLEHACETFLTEAKTIVHERTKMTKVLEHQHVLTDLLELPQLMDTCVWNGYYAEAMDLAAHVRLLQVRYPHLPVIETIQTQVQASSDLMLIQLISHLRQPIKLAAAMNVIGCLRRMDVFASERELRMVFLRCRHSCMQQRLEKIKRPIDDTTTGTAATATTNNTSQESFDYLKRYVDVMREQMFEMATHYMSIFSNKETDTLLPDYMTQLVMQIQQTLKDHLASIDDTSALASLLTQLQYCGMSLGRVGLDFRPLFARSFEQAVLPLIVRTMDQATELLSIDTLQASTRDLVLPSTWLTNTSPSASDPTTTATSNPYQPPALLVDYPCLAIFTNGILTALNALRLLPAISLCSPVKQHLDACLLEIANSMKVYGDQVLVANREEVSLVESFVAAYVRCCAPFLQRCLVEGIFGYSVEGNLGLEDVLKDYLVSAKAVDSTSQQDHSDETTAQEESVDNDDPVTQQQHSNDDQKEQQDVVIEKDDGQLDDPPVTMAQPSESTETTTAAIEDHVEHPVKNVADPTIMNSISSNTTSTDDHTHTVDDDPAPQSSNEDPDNTEDNTPADNTPADNTPADNTPADNTPADSTPAEEKNNDGTVSTSE
ncbi:hypothetical protein [Absidia glauca]|uniref:Conserved oligomeric Golgi complex subunit 8 n=1 Tax=Absidia glauca TaxID=4829 RepID=A0A163K6B1_ABSGL|nr:hypothetical protein [Absidia glauca]